MSSPVEYVNKVTLSSGKVVLLRDFKIKHYELAVKVAGQKAGNNQMLAAWLMQQELLKMLIVKINDEDIKKTDIESLDNILTAKEHAQLSKVVQQLISEGDEGSDAEGPKLEVVSFGSK